MSDTTPKVPWPLDADGNPVPKEVLDEEARDEFGERGDPADPADDDLVDDFLYDPHAS